MKFKGMAVMAAATALSLGLAGPALASSLSARSKPAPQVTGTRLQSALLPASAFGAGFTADGHKNTGSKLWSTRVVLKPSSLSCQTFAMFIFIGGFGNTAGAVEGIGNPNPDFADPSTVYAGDQAVLQFKTTQAAASFYNQAYAKFKQCGAFTENLFGLQMELTTSSLSTTTVNKNKAFQLIQYADIAALPIASQYQSTAFVLSGTNVYTIDNVSGTNDPISASLLTSLIKRVQALYRHH
ncbi:MAG TPA: hypothetical protein VKU77_06095 [Streptosporangiaceae bacterium]|nr:hypothetical protein [Streptosporangiaceae bacterium]